MGFESPWLLLGLLGVAVPLLLHWYLRRTAPVVPLDAVMHLVLHGKGETRRLRLVHVVLLTLRALIVAGIALLFARPYLNVPAAGGAGERPIAAAIVLDDSMSMRLAGDGGTSWDRGRETALRALKELPAESVVFVVRATRPAIVVPDDASGWDAARAVRYVEGLSASRAGTDLGGAVRAALARVRGSPQRDRRVVVISDFHENPVAGLPSAEELAGIEVVPVDVAPTGPLHNRAVVDVSATPAPDLSPGHVRVRVVVANGAAEPMSEVLSVRAGATAAARRVECPSGGRCDEEFLLEVPEGVRVGEARLPPDDLADDDVRWFSLAPQDRDAVLLVDGDPSRRNGESGAYFVSRALSLRSNDDPGFVVTTVRDDELSPLHLAAVGTVGLLNPGTLSPDRARALADFVASGGGLFLAAGSNADPEAWSATLGVLLPAPVRSVLDLGNPAASAGKSLARVDASHPAVAGVADLLTEAHVGHLLLLENGWRVGSSVVASLEGGVPLLVERRVGRGTVLTWLSSLDRDWTDLPLLPAFAPFVRKAFSYLRIAGGQRPAGAVRVGEPRFVEFPPDADGAIVRPPSGTPLTLTGSAAFEKTAVPGIYIVDFFRKGRPEPVRSEAFVVNPDPEESVLRHGGGPPAVLVRTPASGPDAGAAATTRRLPLLPPFLVGLLLLLLAEAWLRGKA